MTRKTKSDIRQDQVIPNGQARALQLYERSCSMSDGPTNAIRAQWARDALAVFTDSTFRGAHPDTMNKDDLECAIGDLICDLMHFALQQGFDTDVILQQARYHFEFEVKEEG